MECHVERACTFNLEVLEMQSQFMQNQWMIMTPMLVFSGKRIAQCKVIRYIGSFQLGVRFQQLFPLKICNFLPLDRNAGCLSQVAVAPKSAWKQRALKAALKKVATEGQGLQPTSASAAIINQHQQTSSKSQLATCSSYFDKVRL